ncbi:MAG: transcriptional repressor [Oscillospiraceae bacterium]|nr:transcriptional repressor [Oscillospiraceae bacterium]MBQ8731296.1 transcriptional repressor [Oscillospiraceae bacterium]
MGRNTVQRTLIYQAVCRMHHPTADEVYAEMKKTYPDIGRATVYRNLKVLSEEGKLRRISLSDGADRFDHCLEYHNHLTCSRCGECKDIWEEVPLPKAEGPVYLGGCRVEGHTFHFHGVCAECLAREAE